jgi:HAD superfamily hydrolase (TIGR01662 family)
MINLVKNGFKAILFDLDGTLRYNTPSYLHYFLDCAAHLGVEDTPEKRHAAIRWAHYYWAQSTHLMEDLRLYNERDEEFWNNYSKKFVLAFGCKPELAETTALEINRIMLTEFNPLDSVPADVFDTLETLKRFGYRLAIVTNREKPCQEQLDHLGLSPYFEITVVGGEINLYKPEAGIFLYALKSMRINPEEAIFVGDNYFTDVVGSQRVGLSPVLIDPDRIFPEAECPVIDKMGDLLSLV